VEEKRRRERTLNIFMNQERISWAGHVPSTRTVPLEPELKQSIVADLDRFPGRKEYYRRIGKAWKCGYLLYGPPGTGKSSLVAAMANYLRFNLYDLDLSEVRGNTMLQRLLNTMSNRSILVIEDIDCCFTAASREVGKDHAGEAVTDDSSSEEDNTPEAWDTVRYAASKKLFFLNSRRYHARLISDPELLTIGSRSRSSSTILPSRDCST
jgi:chaperone BCS1